MSMFLSWELVFGKWIPTNIVLTLFVVILFPLLICTDTYNVFAQSTKENLTNSPLLTYYNPDFGLKLEYPSGWKKIEENLGFHTLVSFILSYQNKFDFHNYTQAGIDLRIYPLALNSTSPNTLNISLVKNRPNNETIINYFHTTMAGGLPALAIIYSYHDRDGLFKGAEIWTILPHRDVLLEILYLTRSSFYHTYLAVMKHMVESLKIN